MNFIQQLINTYNKGLKYDNLSKEYTKTIIELDNTKEQLTKERAQFTKTITDLENENILYYKDLEDCQQELSETQIKPESSTFSVKTVVSNLKKKTRSGAYKYAYKGDGKQRDIREALKYKFVTLITMYGNKIIDKYNPTTPLQCVEAVMKYFIYIKKPKYVTDDKKWHKRDYWETADVFLTSWEGDCDAVSNAQHNLIKYILDKKGFSEHYDRLYWHINDNYLGGHANNLWLHTDGYFYTIESTIDAKGTFKKKWLKTPLANDSFYTNTRGIANLNYNTTGNGEINKCFL